MGKVFCGFCGHQELEGRIGDVIKCSSCQCFNAIHFSNSPEDLFIESDEPETVPSDSILSLFTRSTGLSLKELRKKEARIATTTHVEEPGAIALYFPSELFDLQRTASTFRQPDWWIKECCSRSFFPNAIENEGDWFVPAEDIQDYIGAYVLNQDHVDIAKDVSIEEAVQRLFTALMQISSKIDPEFNPLMSGFAYPSLTLDSLIIANSRLEALRGLGVGSETTKRYPSTPFYMDKRYYVFKDMVTEMVLFGEHTKEQLIEMIQTAFPEEYKDPEILFEVWLLENEEATFLFSLPDQESPSRSAAPFN